MKRDDFRNAANLWRAFSAGALGGFGLLAVILKRRGQLPDDPVLNFWIIAAIPIFILLAHLPAMFLWIAEGIAKIKNGKTKFAEQDAGGYRR